MPNKIFLLILIIFMNGNAINIYSQTISSTDDYVYTPDIKSVKFYASSNPLSSPISDVLGNIPLTFEFDDISGESRSYYYKIIHCDMDWNVSKNINENDYLNGYNDIEIKNYSNSSFTLIPYIHYSMYLPNKDTRWTISGNYLLMIYDDDDEPVIIRRFMVSENTVKVFATLDHPKDVSKYYTHQTLDIQLNTKDYYVVDPLKELKVDVLQNDRWSDAITDISPKYLAGYDLTFDEFDPFTFKSLNEFRNADFRSLKYTNVDIHSIDIRRNGVNIILEKDEMRRNSNYFLWNDINGNFLNLNLDNNDINRSEYCNVTFTLKTYAAIPDQKIYVTGAFCEWQLYDENELEYDKELDAYTGTILLKQGVYDYYYALVDKSGKVDYSALEGSHYQTENDYTILVYQRPFGGKYDKLVGVRVVE